MVNVVGVWFSRYFDSLTAFKSVEICRTLFESLLVSKSVEICRFRYLVDLYLVGVDCLEENCEPRLIYLGLLSIVVHQFLAHGAAFGY
jgi:hypothetical protein